MVKLSQGFSADPVDILFILLSRKTNQFYWKNILNFPWTQCEVSPLEKSDQIPIDSLLTIYPG